MTCYSSQITCSSLGVQQSGDVIEWADDDGQGRSGVVDEKKLSPCTKEVAMVPRVWRPRRGGKERGARIGGGANHAVITLEVSRFAYSVRLLQKDLISASPELELLSGSQLPGWTTIFVQDVDEEK
ncbi:hypothetical protein B0H19DRAFT_1078058 [Mycena capillaripes]|nr:hypothetical protein B0H19DRAFT_1078058 [Mycena capillaripes]